MSLLDWDEYEGSSDDMEWRTPKRIKCNLPALQEGYLALYHTQFTPFLVDSVSSIASNQARIMFLIVLLAVYCFKDTRLCRLNELGAEIEE
ncbi:hypothetical protein GJ744_001939 [Endocarpon pusillum]|uniref:Uncharacterized protein n=1 Tax=Endocarpon pusillum TaxID=364733 RepID=A0A8H7ASI3_9EURO|nr:hypothetical protein GJ744_001939 [Endocarpon pusillum]